MSMNYFKPTLDDVLEMDFISLVGEPAHNKKAYKFKKEEKHYFIENEEKRIVTGVAIATYEPIPRFSKEHGEYAIVFTEEVTFEIGKRLLKSNYLHNVNFEHNEKDKANSMQLCELYFVDSKKGHYAPDVFKSQKLNDGSMIVSYYVSDDKEWQKVKDGTFQGFSIEVYMNIEPYQFNNKKQIKMSKKQGLLSRLAASVAMFNTNEQEPKKFATWTTIDGKTITYEGEELIPNETIISIVGEETTEIAPEGVYAVAMEDNTVLLITVGEGGVFLSSETEEEITDVEAIVEAVEEMSKALRFSDDKYAKLMAELRADFEAKLAEMKNEFMTALENGVKLSKQNNPKKVEGKDDFVNILKKMK